MNTKQEKLDRLAGNTPSTQESNPHKKPKYKSGRLIEVDMADFRLHPLWDILLETVHSSPRYANLVGYAREYVLSENPDISPRQLASRLSITIGEALAILHEDGPEE